MSCRTMVILPFSNNGDCTLQMKRASFFLSTSGGIVHVPHQQRRGFQQTTTQISYVEVACIWRYVGRDWWNIGLPSWWARCL